MSRNICDIHDEIMKKSNKIGRLKSGDYEDINSLMEEFQDFANEVYSLAYDAKEAGQKMENRLKDYRQSIEGLGFIRKD